MNAVLAAARSFVLLVARIGLGGILLLHGWFRWTGGVGPNQGVQRQIDYLSQFAVPYPEVAAWVLIGVELVGGLFLVVGALTPLIGLLVVVEQGLLIAYTNWYKGWNLLNPDGTYNGGFEYMVALGLLGLVFLVFGGGRVSLDALFRRDKTDDTTAGSAGTASTTSTATGRPGTGTGSTGTTGRPYGTPRSVNGTAADTPTVTRPRVQV